MLLLFPSLLAHNQIAPLIIRIIGGATLGHFGYQKSIDQGQSSGSNSRVYGVIEAILSIMIIIGLLTQFAALLCIIILVIKIGLKAREHKLLTSGVNYYILLLAMMISLLFTGPGLLSFDGFL
jgi:uncharacterized membrane protein YphA (DoxX/SURF4 family)